MKTKKNIETFYTDKSQALQHKRQKNQSKGNMKDKKITGIATSEFFKSWIWQHERQPLLTGKAQKNDRYGKILEGKSHFVIKPLSSFMAVL